MSYGNRCRKHAGSDRAFNRQGYDGRAARRQVVNAPLRSWWTDGDFYTQARIEAERMNKGSSVNYTPKEG